MKTENGRIWQEASDKFGSTKMPKREVFNFLMNKARQQGAKAERERLIERLEEIRTESIEDGDLLYSVFVDKIKDFIIDEMLKIRNSEG